MKEMEEGYFEGDQPWSNEDQPPKWDALQVACGFAATLLLFACWANVFTASVGVVGGIIAIISIFLSEGLARKVMAGIVGGALILIALAEWSFPSFQQPLAWYPDDPSDGLVPYRMRPLYGVFLNIWGWVCFSSIFLVPGGEGYERYVSSNLKFYVGRLIASFFLFIYGLFGLINLITYNYNYEYYYALGMALGIPCELGVMVAAALLVVCIIHPPFFFFFFFFFFSHTIHSSFSQASIKKKSFQLAMIAAIVGAIFLILNKFFGFFGIVYTGYFMPFISLRIFNYAFACSMAVVWVIVCYDYGQGGGVGGGGVGGGGVVGDGDLEKGDWPVDLCDCCGGIFLCFFFFFFFFFFFLAFWHFVFHFDSFFVFFSFL